MAGEAVVGLKCRAYYDPDGVGGSTWADLNKIGNVSIPKSYNEGTLRERASAYELTLLGHKILEARITLTRRPGDAAYEALLAAHESGSDIGIALMTGDITTVGSEGPQADFKVPGWEISEPDDGNASTVEVTLKPSGESATAPAYVEITV